MLHHSLRLEDLRDGLEDYEYSCALRGAVERLEKTNRGLPCSLLRDARALRVLPPNVAKAINDWSRDPRDLLEYRERVARMVEKAETTIRQRGNTEQ